MRHKRLSQETVPDCRQCGVCCIALEDQECWCDVLDRDLERLSPKFRKKAVLVDANTTAIRTRWARQKVGPLKGYELNTCVALRGSVLHRVCCTIYKNRPLVCRHSFQPGDKGCQGYRWNLLRVAEERDEEA